MAEAVNVADLETLARERLAPEVFEYYAGGAWDMQTLHENCDAYRRLRIHYRVLRDVSRRTMECEILGLKLKSPIIVAPTAFHKLAHPEAELATVRGAGGAGALFTLSSLSTTRLEEVAAAASGPLWFQLYINKDREFTRALIQRAVSAGYRAIVVTCDTPCWSVREMDVRNGFHLPRGVEAVNLLDSDDKACFVSHAGSGMHEMMAWMLDDSLTWKDLAWVAEVAGAPVLAKGICRPEDALLALDHGAQGVIVSNHGGRQMDGAPATIDVLPSVVEAVNGRAPVLVDGGIRRGGDVFKALAAGAAAVQVGRPVLWALATGGAEGVCHALSLFQHELDLTMALAGCSSVGEITRDLVRRA